MEVIVFLGRCNRRRERDHLREHHFSEAISLPLIAELSHKAVDALDAYPAEGRLLVVGLVRLLYQPYRLQHIRDVIEPADLGLELLGIVHGSGGLFVLLDGDLPGRVLKRNDLAPSHEKPYELLAQDPQRLVSLVLALLFVFVFVEAPDKERAFVLAARVG